MDKSLFAYCRNAFLSTAEMWVVHSFPQPLWSKICCATFPQFIFPQSTILVERIFFVGTGLLDGPQMHLFCLCTPGPAAPMRLGVTFLSANKKVTKEVASRGAEWIAPAIQSRPLEPPARINLLPEELNLHPDSRENVPIFSGMGGAVLF